MSDLFYQRAYSDQLTVVFGSLILRNIDDSVGVSSKHVLLVVQYDYIFCAHSQF